MTQINDILNNYNMRDAKNIFKTIITSVEPFGSPAWEKVVMSAKTSALVNPTTPHVSTRSMPNVSSSQILDRMSKEMNGFIAYAITHPSPDHSHIFSHLYGAFTSVKPDEITDQTWYPFTDFYFRTKLEILWGTEWRKGEIDPSMDKPVVTPTKVVSPPSPVSPGKPATPTNPKSSKINVDPAKAGMANLLIKEATGGSVTDLGKLISDLDQAKQEVADLKQKQTATPAVPAVITATTSNSKNVEPIPSGKIVRKNAKQVFGVQGATSMLDFDINTWQWDAPNPFVPKLDIHHQFDVEALSATLFGLESNQNIWISGQTGTGKSTHAMQIAARTGQMLRRVNFDSDMARYDLIGKVDIQEGENGSVTFFNEGIVPRTMQTPSILLLDEADAIRGDINYALQSVLEGKPLLLTEDAGRIVVPNEFFRIIATANTQGSGDSTGMYSAGVKVQSRASINRYSVFLDIDYLPPRKELALVKKHVPALSKQGEANLYEFVSQYRKAYKANTISTPISPRNSITMAKIITFYESIGTPVAKATEMAMRMNVIMSADESDKDTIIGIADKVVA
ncbi:MAG: hypothetical protein CMF29_08490 [Kiritimatiellaceae bacterium]|nr:hypothetical protein [Kiritimatiellaceae bacterium]